MNRPMNGQVEGAAELRSLRIAQRELWPKFGHCRDQPRGTVERGITHQIKEPIDFNWAVLVGGAYVCVRVVKKKKKGIVCRYCQGAHFSARCPNARPPPEPVPEKAVPTITKTLEPNPFELSRKSSRQLVTSSSGDQQERAEAPPLLPPPVVANGETYNSPPTPPNGGAHLKMEHVPVSGSRQSEVPQPRRPAPVNQEPSAELVGEMKWVTATATDYEQSPPARQAIPLDNNPYDHYPQEPTSRRTPRTPNHNASHSFADMGVRGGHVGRSPRDHGRREEYGDPIVHRSRHSHGRGYSGPPVDVEWSDGNSSVMTFAKVLNKYTMESNGRSSRSSSRHTARPNAVLEEFLHGDMHQREMHHHSYSRTPRGMHNSRDHQPPDPYGLNQYERSSHLDQQRREARALEKQRRLLLKQRQQQLEARRAHHHHEMPVRNARHQHSRDHRDEQLRAYERELAYLDDAELHELQRREYVARSAAAEGYQSSGADGYQGGRQYYHQAAAE